jgi:Fe-S-cluster-containing hydrogenase component 2
MRTNAKKAVVGQSCVACGSCESACPKSALHVFRGVRAVVDTPRCIGCGRCARVCPAGVIAIMTEGGI